MDCFGKLKCKLGMHDFIKQAHWCDKQCTVAIVEYMCSRCGHEAFDLVLFDDERCKILNRIPTGINMIEATKLGECEKVECEISGEEKPKKRARKPKA